MKANPSCKEPSTDDESSSSEKDSSKFAMFTRKFKKFLRKEGKNYRRKPFNGKKITKSKSNTFKISNIVVCYNYKKSGHIQRECPEVYRMKQFRWKGKKPKVMIYT